MPKLCAVRLAVLYEQITQCHTEKIKLIITWTINFHTQIIVIEYYRHEVSSKQTKTAKWLGVPRRYSHLSLNKCLFVSVCLLCFCSQLHSGCFLVLVLCCSGGCLLCMLCFLHELFPLIKCRSFLWKWYILFY